MQERYIFTRNYRDIKKGSLLYVSEENEKQIVTIYDPDYEEVTHDLSTLEGLEIYLLQIEPGMFLKVHDSPDYNIWMREKMTDKADFNGMQLFKNDDDSGMPTAQPLYPEIHKCPETLVMYLRDCGMTNVQILAQMFGPSSEYMAYLTIANLERRDFLLRNPF